MLIQLLYCPDCPNVGAAREALREALANVGGNWQVTELEVTRPGAPAHVKSWGSPTILVDGVDVARDDASGSCCRLYPGSATRGAPSPGMIEDALRRVLEPSSTPLRAGAAQPGSRNRQ
jgi:hypothetical protein